MTPNADPACAIRPSTSFPGWYKSPCRCARRAPFPTACPVLQSHDCESGVCNLGYCVGSVWPDGTPCTTDAACQSGNCYNLICSADDCGDGTLRLPGELLSSSDAVLQPDPAVPGRLREVSKRALVRGDSDCISGSCSGILGCQRECDNGICEAGEACSTSFIDLSQTCTSDCGKCGNGYTCDAGTDCLSGHCESGYCTPRPLTCIDLGDCPNGSICTQNSNCASGRCLGAPFGTKYCIQQGCIAPGSYCGPGSSGSCCNFPGVNLSCTGFPTYYCDP